MNQQQAIITTYSGIDIDVTNPNPNHINIIDIAHALANQCRFGGHSNIFYSVAQHSINITDYFYSPKLKLIALLHDASEAYLIDIPKPIKNILTQYQILENNLQNVIYDKFNIIPTITELQEIKQADKSLFNIEKYELIDRKSPQNIIPIPPQIIEINFINTFYDIINPNISTIANKLSLKPKFPKINKLFSIAEYNTIKTTLLNQNDTLNTKINTLIDDYIPSQNLTRIEKQRLKEITDKTNDIIIPGLMKNDIYQLNPQNAKINLLNKFYQLNNNNFSITSI